MGEAIEASASFGAWVRGRRTALDLTQADLADRVACAVITIRKIEADERRPSKVMAARLAEALAIDEAKRDRFVAVARAYVSPVRLPLATEGAPSSVASAPSGEDPVGSMPSTLPAPLHRLIGREDDLARLTELVAVAGGPARLVTITGPPGVGKTRLAVEVGRKVAQAFDVAVVLVELAAADDADALRERIASAVAVSGPPGADRFGMVVGALARAPSLVVLDNFEQVVDAAPVVGELLAAVPDLSCVVTSRVRLDIYGEHEYALAPLDAPPDGAVDPAGIDTWPAAALFLERARAANASLSLDAVDTAAVARICRRLDGLPLALELAARRARDISLVELADDLAVGLGALGTGGRDVDERHRTMTGAVEWSYALLTGAAQRLLRALAVTDASFDRDGAAALVDEPVGEVAPALTELVDHGLVHRVEDRFALFEVVRAVAAARLDDLGEAPEVRRRHGALHLARLEAVAPECLGDEDLAALELISRDYTDLRAALEWAFGAGDAAAGRRLVALLSGYWYSACLWQEGAHWARVAYESTDDPVERAWPALALATVSWLDDPEAVPRLIAEAETGARAGGDELLLAQIVGGRGFQAMMAGELEMARDLLEESGTRFRAAGSLVGEALTELRLGRLAGMAGDPEEFAEHTGRAAELAAARGRDFTLGIARGDQSEAALMVGDTDAALPLAVEGFTLLAALGVDWYAAGALTCVANVLAETGRLEDAARLCGVVEGWLEDLEAPVLPTWAVAYGRHREVLAETLGERFDGLVAEGRLLPRTAEQVRAMTGLAG